MKKLTIGLISGILILCAILTILVMKENDLKEKTSKFYDDLAVGETATLEYGSEVTLNSATLISEHGEHKPSKGKFLMLEITIKNESPREMYVSAILDFQLKDANGNSHNTVPKIVEGPQLNETIPKKGELKATVAYDVPESEYYELIYRENYSYKMSNWIIK